MNYNWLENGNNITRIDVSFVDITTVPILPLNLEVLCADNNFNLETIPVLPMRLRVLSLCLTGIQVLPELPETLEELYVSENPGICIEKLPPNLVVFVANSCELEELPNLPPSLTTLVVDGNYLEGLPELPTTMKIIIASNNQVLWLSRNIADLIHLEVLMVQNNVIRHIPTLPTGLREFNCAENNLKRLPILPESLIDFVFFGNPLIYEFHHKRISAKDYVNGINRFVRSMSLSIIIHWLDSHIEKKKTPETPNSNWETYSKKSFSLMSSFMAVAFI